MLLDKFIEVLSKGEYLSEKELRLVCEMCREILVEESNVQFVQSPVTVCGDIHGQLFDMLELFRTGGDIPKSSYIFLGDYVDRGPHSIETFSLLMCLKIKYPEHITLLRGNHETRQITQTYGFYTECMKKYGTANAWKFVTEVFDCLNVAAVIDNRIFCVHGGLSPSLRTIDQIQEFNRFKEIPLDGPFSDIMWSDPEATFGGWGRNVRGAGLNFGNRIVEEFNQINSLDLICRAHQLVNKGFQYMFDKKLVTVWSAPNYCNRCKNVAAILEFDEYLQQTPRLFKEVPETHKAFEDSIGMHLPSHFM